MKAKLHQAGAWLLARAGEKSTWTGLSILVTIVGGNAMGANVQQIGEAVGLIFSGHLVVTREAAR